MKKDDVVRVHMSAPTEWARRIDEWRRYQEDLPNLSEAIRRLVDIGLREEMRGKKERLRA